jgi:hypothetical protein
MDDYEEDMDMMDFDPMNRQRNIRNILSKRKISKYELDEIFAE